MQAHPRIAAVQVHQAGVGRGVRIRVARPQVEQPPGNRRPCLSGLRMDRRVAIARRVGDPAEGTQVGHHDAHRLTARRHWPVERRALYRRQHLFDQRFLGGGVEQGRQEAESGGVHPVFYHALAAAAEPGGRAPCSRSCNNEIRRIMFAFSDAAAGDDPDQAESLRTSRKARDFWKLGRLRRRMPLPLAPIALYGFALAAATPVPICPSKQRRPRAEASAWNRRGRFSDRLKLWRPDRTGDGSKGRFIFRRPPLSPANKRSEIEFS